MDSYAPDRGGPSHKPSLKHHVPLRVENIRLVFDWLSRWVQTRPPSHALELISGSGRACLKDEYHDVVCRLASVREVRPKLHKG